MACIRLPRVSLRTLGRHPSDASPSSTSRGDITATFACASASCASRPPGLIESIDPRQALRARPVVMVTTGPTTAGSTCGTLACVPPSTCLAPECWSGASLEVFVPCNAHWLRSRYPGRPASGRSRFGVSIFASTRAFSVQPVDEMSFSSPLRFSAVSGFIAMKLVQRTRLAGAFRSNPSLARRLGPNGPSCVRVGG